MENIKLINYRIAIYVFFLLFFIENGYSQGKAKYDSLDIVIENYLSVNNVPGLAACIVKGDEVIWKNAYGFANIDKQKPFRLESVMHIASVSKLFTTTAIMQLWEQGKLELDTDINEYLPISVRNPKFPDASITVRQLLTHTSTLADGSAYWNSYACGDPGISLKYWITNYFSSEGEFYNETENFLPNKPGTINRYSNTGFGLLGYIVEEISNTPFNEYCNNNIFKPLGMKNTGWLISEIELTKHVTPYVYMSNEIRDEMANDFSHLCPGEKEFALGKNIATCLFSSPNYPDGMLKTNINELSNFLVACMNKGKYENVSILKEQTLNKMLNSQNSSDHNHGFCWYKKGQFWGHNGIDPGVQTEMFFEPETNIGIIIFQNSLLESDTFSLLKKIYSIASNK